MSVDTVSNATIRMARPPRAPTKPSHPAFAASLFALAAVLVANTALGPLGSGTIRYPITGTLLNQTIGLEVTTVGLVVPLALVAAVLASRGHPAAPLLGFGPSAYAAYMFVQYVVGPEYDRYTSTILFHTLVFTLAGAASVWAWVLASRQPMPPLTARKRRVLGVTLLVLAGFIVSRYLSVIGGGALPPEFTQARTFFWSIFLLDLGVVVPATLLAGVGLLRGAELAQPALYALMGWYALVPPSVAAMSVTMVVNDDPHAAAGQAIMFTCVATVVAALAVRVFLPLLRRV